MTTTVHWLIFIINMLTCTLLIPRYVQAADWGKNKARWTYVMSLDGKGKPRNITKGEGESNPVWSPTGTEIAYTALAGKSLSIYILSLWNWRPRISIKAIETTEPFNVTDAPPTWSPNGEKIVFSSKPRRGFGDPYHGCRPRQT